MKDMPPEDIQKTIVLSILKEEESKEAPLIVLPDESAEITDSERYLIEETGVKVTVNAEPSIIDLGILGVNKKKSSSGNCSFLNY